MATFAHFSGIIGFLPAAAIYYLYRDRAPFTEQESREAMNFTLLPSIMILVLLILSFVPGMASLMMFFTAILWLYMAIRRSSTEKKWKGNSNNRQPSAAYKQTYTSYKAPRVTISIWNMWPFIFMRILHTI